MQRQTVNLLIIIIWEEVYVVGQVVDDQSNPNQISVAAPVPDRDAIFTTRTEPFDNISMRSIYFIKTNHAISSSCSMFGQLAQLFNFFG